MISLTDLYQIYLQHPTITTDSRNVVKGSLFFALKGDRFDGNQYAAKAIASGAAYVVVDNENVANQLGDKALFCKDSLITLQALANHHRKQLSMPILAITGSNGKTTTKELVAAVMSQRYVVHATPGNYNNHIGLPLTILQIGPEVEMAILEMGANHQGEIAALCKIAEPTHGLITNIGEAHLEGFGGIEGVKIGKGELYDYLAANKGVAFVNLDAEFLPEMAQRVSRRINYGEQNSASAAVNALECKLISVSPNVKLSFLDEQHKPIEISTQLPGQHNFENIKGAIAVGSYFKVAAADIKTGLESYTPDNNRSQRKNYKSVDFWMDAYNANPSSVAASLHSFCTAASAPRVAILGQMLELGEVSSKSHLHIARLAKELPIEQVILVGQEYEAVAEAMQFTYFPNSQVLKEWFWQQNWTNKTVLLKGSRGVALEILIA